MRQFGRDLAADPNRPDGIICDSELCAICMVVGLADGGLRSGRDFHCICKQTSDLLDTLYPSIDTIDEDVVAAGTELARLLIRRIGGDLPEALSTLSEPLAHWRDRDG
jgi:LacI family transcriptional regulator